jgi:hypothetical protein
MADIIFRASRYVALACALVAFYLACFLYEDEEGLWQNKIDTFWISVNDRAKLTDSKTTALCNKTASVLTSAFDRFFGHRPISLQSIAVSTCASTGGAAAAWLSWGAYNDFSYFRTSRFVFEYLTIAGLCFLMAALPGLTKHKWTIGISLIPIVGYSLIIARLSLRPETDFVVFNWGPAFYMIQRSDCVPLTLSLLAGFASDILMIVWMRYLFVYVSRATTFVRILVATCCTCLLASGLSFGPWILGRDHEWATWGNTVEDLGFLNFSTLLYFVPPVAILIFLLVHKMFWPSLCRLVYPLSRHNLVKNRKFMFGAGTLLLGFALNLERVGLTQIVKLFAP